jgi:alpha-glucosidase
VTDNDVTLPCPGTVVLTSAPLANLGEMVTLPANTTVWWRVPAEPQRE